MARPCAFRDCGDPDCRLCGLARESRALRERELVEASDLRKGARAEPKAPAARQGPKRSHRVGPHR